ncbi:TPA: hypothetical protein ACNIE0_005260 [Pseudomonas aeruginosa]
MNIVFPAKKTDALLALQPGESLMIACNDMTVQSVQSSIQSIASKKGIGCITQRKALIVFDEQTLPIPVIVVTKQAQASLKEVVRAVAS